MNFDPHARRDSVQLSVALHLMSAAKKWKRRVARLFERAGHTGAPIVVLYHLSTAPGGLTLSELALRMELVPSTLTRLVARLEKDDLVSRHAMFGDARMRLIKLMPAGRSELERFDVEARAMRDRLLADVPQADLETMDRVLKILIGRLSEGPDAVRPAVRSTKKA